MTTIVTHAAVAVAIGAMFPPRSVPRRWWIAGAIGAMLPDIDVIGFRFHVDYGAFWGHRGFTHSLMFAAIVATLTVACARRLPSPTICGLYLFLAIASHGVLDALTDGGLGVAFLSPFDDSRWFFPLTPIRVSRIGMGFFSAASVAVIVSELLWVWIPATLMCAAGLWLHRQPPQSGTSVEAPARPASGG
jgi:inner membrane protein